MDSDRERVTLSEQERSALAELEALISGSDPRLSGRLDGKPPRFRERNRWLGPALIGVGAVIVVVAFTANLWIALAGAALMAVGLGVVLPQAAAVFSRLGRQAGPGPKAA